MNKDQLYYLLGRPHFAEGFFGVREWDYVFNYRENGAHKMCQFKVLFDTDMNAQSFLWFPNGCNADHTFRLDGDFMFDFDKDVLTSEGEQAVRDLADKLKSLNASTVRVEGHTDRLGSTQYNLNLSQRRAERVAASLQALGVTGDFTTVGLGKSRPVTQCHNASGQALIDCLRPNRRVEVKVEGQSLNNAVAGPNGPSVLYDLSYPKAPAKR